MKIVQNDSTIKQQDQLDALLEVMRALRHPQSGCPWDLEQDYRSIVPHTIEEVYEVVDAIEREDYDQLKFELGDLLFQIVFYSQLAHEQQRFDFMDVAGCIVEKLIRRHPHVFANSQTLTSDQQTQAWETQKAKERAQRANETDQTARLLDDIPMALPGMLRALKIQKRASSVGFDWSQPDAALDKVVEEVDEIRHCLRQADDTEQGSDSRDKTRRADELEDELGDLLFSVVNSARLLRIDPEQAIRRANEKFSQRFRYIEDRLNADNRDFASVDADQLETLWLEAKTDFDDSGRKP